jgi:hypothetical protein
MTHLQSLQTLRSGELSFPVLHTSQVLCPTLLWYLPGGHRLQLVGKGAPLNELILPIAHASQLCEMGDRKEPEKQGLVGIEVGWADGLIVGSGEGEGVGSSVGCFGCWLCCFVVIISQVSLCWFGSVYCLV